MVGQRLIPLELKEALPTVGSRCIPLLIKQWELDVASF